MRALHAPGSGGFAASLGALVGYAEELQHEAGLDTGGDPSAPGTAGQGDEHRFTSTGPWARRYSRGRVTIDGGWR